MQIEIPGESLEPLQVKEEQFSKYIKNKTGERKEYMVIVFCAKKVLYKDEILEVDHYYRFKGSGVVSDTYFITLGALFSFVDNRVQAKMGRRSKNEIRKGTVATSKHHKKAREVMEDLIEEYGEQASADEVAEGEGFDL